MKGRLTTLSSEAEWLIICRKNLSGKNFSLWVILRDVDPEILPHYSVFFLFFIDFVFRTYSRFNSPCPRFTMEKALSGSAVCSRCPHDSAARNIVQWLLHGRECEHFSLPIWEVMYLYFIVQLSLIYVLQSKWL